ncbi:MAG TPA: NADPH:quinone oxidoreductase family protein [Acidimicrobiales bacterium]|nr:NADPH:quinone oxidoreductase family protein [Acidimicrobiales bacterium]
MRAAVCRAYGPPESVTVEDVPPPTLGPGQVRVRVGTAAVNFPDVLLVAGTYQLQVPPPFVPGSELAGEVTELGSDVTSLSVGQHVFGSTLVGAFAEEAAVTATSLTPVPAGVADRLAAAFGVAHRTAYHVLRSVARLCAGEELVVLGAGGGVGLAVVQLGRILGATVTAVASSPVKLEAAAAFGATRLIDHRRGDLRTALREVLPDGADVVVDPVGGSLAEPALRALHFGGRFVTVGFASGEIPRIALNLVLLKGVQVLGFQFADFARHLPQELERNEAELLELFASGTAFPHIGASFGLGDVAGALAHVGAGRAVGKVVLEIGG